MSGLIAHIRKAAGGMAYGTSLYNWSLNTSIPERMVVRPVDPWPGNSEYGRIICEGGLPESYNGRALHTFSWLRDLRAYAQEGGASAAARMQARVMIASWIDRHGKWEPGAWDTDLVGERVSMWISAYEFFAQFSHEMSEEDSDFQDYFFQSLAKQSCHLSRILMREDCGATGLGALSAVKGLLYAGLAFEGKEAWVSQAIACLKKQVEIQILSDGCHRSRSPMILFEALRTMLDIRMALRSGDYPEPEIVTSAIERMGRAFIFFRYNDKGLAVFNGAQEGDVHQMDAVISQAGIRGKTPKELPQGGYEKLVLGRTSVMIDCGKSPAFPYDERAHSGTLSFEMIHGKERIVVNCGTHTGSGMVADQWREALRASPAHSTLILADRNSCETGEGASRRIRKCAVRKDDAEGAVLLEASHDGYESLNGYTHRRRYYICDHGDDFRGEDMLSSTMRPERATPFSVRFHLHPRVMISLIQGGREALLRLPSGVGFRFSFSCGNMAAGRLALEESVYMGKDNTYRKCYQLAIYGQAVERKCKIMWGFRREG
ncbi:MAG: heparinase II/III family protein [Micavibrio sp.]|nr:heparinase II/III family protein [Micavibrio sp.]